jgi:hypothetical protein
MRHTFYRAFSRFAPHAAGTPELLAAACAELGLGG